MPCQACQEFKEKHVRYKTGTVTKEEAERLGFDPDYSQPCTAGGTCACRLLGEGVLCSVPSECSKNNACTCSCPAPSKPNSHYVSNTCIAIMDDSLCVCSGTPKKCRGGTCVCTCGGLCYYACDADHYWNGSDCVPKEILMDGFMYID